MGSFRLKENKTRNVLGRRKLSKQCTSAAFVLGNSEWSMMESEKESRRLRHSLYFVQDVKSGDAVTHENVPVIRPGRGYSPKLLEKLLGKKFVSDQLIGAAMSLDLVK